MVKSGRGIYLFCGDDSFSREEARKRLLKKVLSSAKSKLNYDTYEAKDDFSSIFDAINTLPFLSDIRVVAINHIEQLPEFKRENFLKYLENPGTHTCLILNSGQGSRSNKFIKAISERAETFSFKKLKPYEIRSWVHESLKRQNKTITKDALELLLELKGFNSLEVLSSELEKILLYKGNERVINQEDIARLVGKSSVRKTFDLVDAIGRKDRSSALFLVREMSQGKRAAAPEALGLIGWQIRRLWKAKKLLSGRMDRAAVCSELNVKSFSADKFIYQVSCFRSDELERDFGLLVEADRNIKRGLKKAEFVLEELVAELCSA